MKRILSLLAVMALVLSSFATASTGRLEPASASEGDDATTATTLGMPEESATATPMAKGGKSCPQNGRVGLPELGHRHSDLGHRA